jgi:molybdate transport system ATP-binding protein
MVIVRIIIGTIIEYMCGRSCQRKVEVDKQLKILAMTVPVHVARRNELGYGVRVTISLLTEGIH